MVGSRQDAARTSSSARAVIVAVATGIILMSCGPSAATPEPPTAVSAGPSGTGPATAAPQGTLSPSEPRSTTTPRAPGPTPSVEAQPSATSAPPASGETEEPGDDVNAVMGSSFQLKIGQTAVISAEGVRVTFLDVTEDSRCPLDADCDWEGQVTILVNARTNGQYHDDKSLTIHPSDEALSVGAFDGYFIKLLAVDPYPRFGQKIVPSEYVATLVLSRDANQLGNE